MGENEITEIKINKDYAYLGKSEIISRESRDIKTKKIINNKTILTSDYVNRISSKVNGELSILPPNCRYFEEISSGSSNGYLVIIEEPPLIRTVSIDSSVQVKLNQLKKENKLEEYDVKEYIDKSRPHKFTLAFPYVIFIMIFTEDFSYVKSNIFVRTQQMSGLSDVLFRMPMLNINNSQDVCYGSQVGVRNESLFGAVQNTINTWWGAEFNHDYEANFSEYQKVPIVHDYLEWQYQSRINPLFVFNLDWIPYKHNIFHAIQRLKDISYHTSKKMITYVDMINLFTQPRRSDEKSKPTPKSRRIAHLYFDVAQSVFLKDNLYLNVGDPIRMQNDKTAFVYSLVGFSNGGDIRYVQLEQNGKLFLMKFTDSFIKFIVQQINDSRYVQTVTLSNGITIKANDILVVKSKVGDSYRKVEYIRKSRNIDNEECFEVKCGPSYYPAETLDAQLFNMQKPLIGDIEVESGKEYITIKNYNEGHIGALKPSYKSEFKSIDISSDGKTIIVQFSTTNAGVSGEIIKYKLNNVSKIPLIIELEKVRPLPGLFRCGRKPFIVNYDNKPAENAVWAYNGCVHYETYYSFNNISKSRAQDLIQGDTFFIAGPDFDTTFKIGDQVVVANWTKPIEVLNVKTIQGFKYNKDNGEISFVLQSNDGTISEEVYVSTPKYLIKTGYIRKVVSKFDKLSVGTKIIAKKSGVANFPKKDINIVVAIIIDGPHEPLVLCSNGCTLWYSTIMKDFQKITMKSKRWAKLQHVPLDLSKIKFQAGDIINGRTEFRNDHGYILLDPSPTRYLKALPITYYQAYPDMKRFDKYFISDAMFECIPTPRLSPAKQASLGTVSGYFDFHGGVIEDQYNESLLDFINERGGC